MLRCPPPRSLAGVFAVQAIGICFGLILHHADNGRPSKWKEQDEQNTESDAREEMEVAEEAAQGAHEAPKAPPQKVKKNDKGSTKSDAEAPIRASATQLRDLRRMLEVIEEQSLTNGDPWLQPARLPPPPAAQWVPEPVAQAHVLELEAKARSLPRPFSASSGNPFFQTSRSGTWRRFCSSSSSRHCARSRPGCIQTTPLPRST